MDASIKVRPIGAALPGIGPSDVTAYCQGSLGRMGLIQRPMTKVPGRHIPAAVSRSPEAEVGPVNFGLGGSGRVEGGAGVAVQEDVIPSRLAGLNREIPPWHRNGLGCLVAKRNSSAGA